METVDFISSEETFEDADRTWLSVGDIVARIVGAILADRDEDGAVGAAPLDEE